jgi:phosphohistidine phosphatase
MNLFVLRHASAGNSIADPEADRKRPLDKDGVRHCLQQTANLVATETGYRGRVVQSNSLVPEATLKDFKKLLDEYRDRDNILVVGHNPNLSIFLGALLVPAVASPARIRLRKGSLARLSLTPGATTLQSVLDPRVVRTLYAISAKGPGSKSRKGKS